MNDHEKAQRERMERLLRDDLARLDTIRHGLSPHQREQEWHRQHTDRIKRRVDETAKRLDK